MKEGKMTKNSVIRENQELFFGEQKNQSINLSKKN